MAPRKTQRKRVAKRKDTKDLLADTAERLFAESGIKQVSLHAIAAKAGLANKFSVQYHFKNRDGLIRRIFERRLPQLDARRAEMLTQIRSDGRLKDPAALVEVMFTPIAELVDSRGRHTFARFQLALYEYERAWRTRLNADDLTPFTKYLSGLLADSLPHLSPDEFVQRCVSMTLVFLDLLARVDDNELELTTARAIKRGVTLAVAILKAPIDL